MDKTLKVLSGSDEICDFHVPMSVIPVKVFSFKKMSRRAMSSLRLRKSFMIESVANDARTDGDTLEPVFCDSHRFTFGGESKTSQCISCATDADHFRRTRDVSTEVG